MLVCCNLFPLANLLHVNDTYCGSFLRCHGVVFSGCFWVVYTAFGFGSLSFGVFFGFCRFFSCLCLCLGPSKFLVGRTRVIGKGGRANPGALKCRAYIVVYTCP